MGSKRRLHHDESGAYAAMFLAVLIIFVAGAALVVDLGSLWFVRHNAKAVADMASTAGGLALEPTSMEPDTGTPFDGCEAAWSYAVLNLADVDNGAPSPCGVFNPAPTCDPATPVTATGTVGLYTISITWPVADGTGIMDGRITDKIDGDACQRIGVDIFRSGGMLFAGFGGGPSDVTTGASSVARYQSGTSDGDVVALVVLEPQECLALEAKAPAAGAPRGIRVLANEDDPDRPSPGVITVDSDGNDPGNSCNGAQNFVIKPGQGTNSKIEAEQTSEGVLGVIISRAMLSDGNPPKAFSAADVAAGRLVPKPVGGTRITRAPIDWRYNCLASYPDYRGIVPVSGCPEADVRDSEIAALQDDVGVHNLTQANHALKGFTDFKAYVQANFPGTFTNDGCRITGEIPLPPGHDWWVDCPTGGGAGNPGLEIVQGGFLTFPGGGQVVLRGGVQAQSGGSQGYQACGVNDLGSVFQVGDASTDTTLVLQDPDVSNRRSNLRGSSSSSMVCLTRTTVFLENGFTNIASQAQVRWTAPEDDSYPFDDLALWSEGDGQHEMGGQSGMVLEGTFFAPFAIPFNFSGQSTISQPQNAQFVVQQLHVDGGSLLSMKPDPDRVTRIPLSGVRLIR